MRIIHSKCDICVNVVYGQRSHYINGWRKKERIINIFFITLAEIKNSQKMSVRKIDLMLIIYIIFLLMSRILVANECRPRNQHFVGMGHKLENVNKVS